MKVGDLVKYFTSTHPPIQVGVIISVDPSAEHGQAGVRVRWTYHTPSMRDWYTEFELRRVR